MRLKLGAWQALFSRSLTDSQGLVPVADNCNTDADPNVWWRADRSLLEDGINMFCWFRFFGELSNCVLFCSLLFRPFLYCS